MNIERLKDLLFYNHETGVLYHRKRRTGVPYAGMTAGTKVNCGGIIYLNVGLDGKKLKAHRVAWAIYHGKEPEFEIDHINGDTLDNRIVNLREVNSAVNCKNKTLYARNKSGVSGIYWNADCQKWHARISHQNKRIHLGFFDDLEEAKKVRLEAESTYGYHSNHGRKKTEALPSSDS